MTPSSAAEFQSHDAGRGGSAHPETGNRSVVKRTPEKRKHVEMPVTLATTCVG